MLVMTKRRDPNRFHRVIGWLSAIASWIFFALPALAIVSVGECLQRVNIQQAECVADKRATFFFVLFGTPLLAAAIGWVAYRWSKFLG